MVVLVAMAAVVMAVAATQRRLLSSQCNLETFIYLFIFILYLCCTIFTYSILPIDTIYLLVR